MPRHDLVTIKHMLDAARNVERIEVGAGDGRGSVILVSGDANV